MRGTLLLVTCLAPLAAQDPIAERASTVVRGTCVRGEDGAPLAGCHVVLTAQVRNREDGEMFGTSPWWRDPKPVLTGADGRFEFRVKLPKAYAVNLEITAPGRVMRRGWWYELAAGSVTDLEQVSLAEGHEVSGRVLDTERRGVRGVTVGLGELPLGFDPSDRTQAHLYVHTDAQGRFTFPSAVPKGDWQLTYWGDGIQAVEPAREEITVDGSVRDLMLRVRRLPSISGVVFDDSGRPVAGEIVQVFDGETATNNYAATNADGSFSLYRRTEAPDQVTLRALGKADVEAKSIAEQFRWGMHGVRLELQRALGLDLEVVEDGTGDPVEAFALRCHGVDAGLTQQELRLGGEHAGGKLRVTHVWRGENQLEVFPRDPALVPSGAVRFAAAEGQPVRQRVALLRLVPVTVRVLDSLGKPVAGVHVQLLDLNDLPYDASLYPHEPRANRFYHDPGHSTLLNNSMTDADGRARCLLRTAGKEWALRVRTKRRERGEDLFYREGVELPADGEELVLRKKRK